MDQEPQPRRLTIEEVVNHCCNVLGVNLLTLRGENRGAALLEQRQLIARLACTMFGHSSPAVGRALNRDHTTIIAGLKSIKDKLARDPELASKEMQLRRFLAYKALEPVPVAQVVTKPLQPPPEATLSELLVRIPDPNELRDRIIELRKKRRGSVRSIAKRLQIEERVVAYYLGVQWGNAA